MKAILYLDNAATTPVDPRVVEAMIACLGPNAEFANPASGHALGTRARHLVERARTAVAARVNAPPARMVLASYRPELLVVCDYGQILKPETLEIPRLGGINLHASLLPKYRGAAPVAWAIYHGETETGVTVIRMTAGVDAGPAIAQARTPIGADETTAASRASSR